MFILIKSILFILPFILIFNHKNKVRMLLYIFSFYVLYMLLTTLILQYFTIFTFNNIFISLIGLNCLILIYFIFNIKKGNKYFWNKNDLKHGFSLENIILFFIFALCFIYLLSPNIAFRGDYVSGVRQSFNIEQNKISDHVTFDKANEGKYNPYPFYSDEWVAYGFIRESIENKNLPIYNYFSPNERFFNPLISYFSFLSYIFLYFNLSIEHFFVIGKIFNLLIIISLFVLMRVLRINKLPAVISSICALFILNTQFVTGLWMFIPFNMGSLFFFLFLIAYLARYKYLHPFLALLSIAFYSPMMIFVFIWYVIHIPYTKDLLKKIAVFFTIIIPVLYALFLLDIHIVNKVLDFLIRPTAYGKIYNANIWNMFDPLFLPLILFGLYISYKKNIKFFSFNLFLILFWIYYYFNQTIIIIDLPRLIMFNCWTFLILIAYALNDVYKKYEIDKLSKDKYIYLSVFILLFLILPQYTRYIIKDYKVTGKGQSIINIFYRDGDIKVFKKYKDKVYIADPWKSLIISSVTGNYPLHTKSSYMGNDIMFFIGFMNANCKEKTERAMKYNIDLVYSPMFKCEDFKLIESGSDNNYLFEFKR